MDCNFRWEAEPDKKLRHRPYIENNVTFKLPSDKIHDTKFENSKQISIFLLKDAFSIGFIKWMIFDKFIYDRGDYNEIIYKCSENNCNAEIIYHEKRTNLEDKSENKRFYLSKIKINNQHKHEIKLTPKELNEENLRQYLFDIPVEDKFENHVNLIKKKFNLNKIQALDLKERVFWRFKDENHMLKKLNERKVVFRRKREGDKSVILLLVSQTMKNNYLRFGDTICFDITYKLLMRKKEEQGHVGVGFFVGQDTNVRILLFGFSIIRVETKENFVELFQFFFEIMEYLPRSIITDDQIALRNALQQIKEENNYDYIHLLDWFHKIESMKKKLKREPNREELMTCFQRLLKEPSQKVYMKIIEEIASFLSRESNMIDFLKEQNKCCLSATPSVFFGFGISSTRAEGFNNLIKRVVPHQTNIGRLTYFVLRVEKRLNHRMAVLNYINPSLTQIIKDEEVLRLVECLEVKVYDQIRQYYEESRQLISFTQIEENPIFYRATYIKYDQTFFFDLCFDIKYNCWRCECKNQFKTGMPCCHIVRAVREFNGCIGYYINERWLHDKNEAQIKKASRPDKNTKRI